jgi:hypothetical protein
VRRAAAVDENQAAVVKALRAYGASVHIIGRPVDLLVGYRGETFILEVKDGLKIPSAQALTPDQVKFFESWRGGDAVVVRSIPEALRAIGAI